MEKLLKNSGCLLDCANCANPGIYVMKKKINSSSGQNICVTGMFNRIIGEDIKGNVKSTSLKWMDMEVLSI